MSTRLKVERNQSFNPRYFKEGEAITVTEGHNPPYHALVLKASPEILNIVHRVPDRLTDTGYILQYEYLSITNVVANKIQIKFMSCEEYSPIMFVEDVITPNLEKGDAIKIYNGHGRYLNTALVTEVRDGSLYYTCGESPWGIKLEYIANGELTVEVLD